MRLTIFTVALALCSFGAKAAGPMQPLRVGNWSGGSFTNDQTGAFSHCSAGSPYQSGIYFMVRVNAQFQWGLGFASTNWRLNPGENIPIDLTFDGRAQYHVFANVLNAQLAVVPMPDTSALIRTFRQARSMQVFAKGQMIPFNLNETSALLPALVACVRANLGQPTQATQAAAVKKPAPRVGTLVPTPTPTPAPPSTDGAGAEMQIEAINLATNFMLKSQLSNPHLLNRQNTPTALASWGAAWKSDDAVGAVKIVPPQEGMKGIDLAAAVAASDASDCKGTFLSGRESDLVDSDVVFRGFAKCEDSEGLRASLYFIVPRTKGGFVLFSVLAQGKPDAVSATSDDKLANYRRAALTSVNY